MAPNEAAGAKRRPADDPSVEDTARFLGNLTSLPDAEFAAAYSPMVANAFAAYDNRRTRMPPNVRSCEASRPH